MHEFIYMKVLTEAPSVAFTDLVKELPMIKRKKLFETETVS